MIYLICFLLGVIVVSIPCAIQEATVKPKRRQIESLIFYITRDVFDVERQRPDSIRYFQGHLKEYESAVEDKETYKMLMDEGLAEFATRKREGEAHQLLERKRRNAAFERGCITSWEEMN